MVGGLTQGWLALLVSAAGLALFIGTVAAIDRRAALAWKRDRERRLKLERQRRRLVAWAQSAAPSPSASPGSTARKADRAPGRRQRQKAG